MREQPRIGKKTYHYESLFLRLGVILLLILQDTVRMITIPNVRLVILIINNLFNAIYIIPI